MNALQKSKPCFWDSNSSNIAVFIDYSLLQLSLQTIRHRLKRLTEVVDAPVEEDTPP